MIITSFGTEGYEKYGRRFIETFLEHWKDETLVVYYETLPEDRTQDERVEWRDLFSIPNTPAFYEKMMASPKIFQGVRTPKGRQLYDYRFDAYRFCRKVFATVDAALRPPEPEERMAWVDADVVFHSDVPDGFLKSILPDEAYTAYLGRESMYTETGFVAFNPSHPAHSPFMRLYGDMYVTGAFKFLGEWHDCYVYDMTRTVMGVPGVDLSGGLECEHPFINSVLGQYMDHLKGPTRKTQGHSNKADMLPEGMNPNTDHSYWKDVADGVVGKSVKDVVEAELGAPAVSLKDAYTKQAVPHE